MGFWSFLKPGPLLQAYFGYLTLEAMWKTSKDIDRMKNEKFTDDELTIISKTIAKSKKVKKLKNEGHDIKNIIEILDVKNVLKGPNRVEKFEKKFKIKWPLQRR